MTTDAITIRRADTRDAQAISRLLHAAFVEYRELYTAGGFGATAISAAQVANRIAEGPVWVAESRDQIVGTVSIVVNGRSLYIRGMAVDPTVRGRRIGEFLLSTIAEYAGTEGCTRLYLNTTPFLNRAIRLYERFGFRRLDEGRDDLHGTPLFTMEKFVSVTAAVATGSGSNLVNPE